MTLVLFEDELVPQLYPVTIGRPAFAITCGSYRLLDLVSKLKTATGKPLQVEVQVRPHLQPIWQNGEDRSASTATAQAKEPVLLVNARLVPSTAVLAQLQTLLTTDLPGVVQRGNRLAAALLPEGVSAPAPQSSPQEFAAAISQLKLPALAGELPWFDYPHDIVRHHLLILRANLEHRLSSGNYQQAADGVFLASGAKLGQYVVTDTSRGPIVLEENASVGPYCYLHGPAHLDAAARVIEHSAIKDGVALGHTTKVGGEIEGSIIEPYTNKQHHGFLGHSYLGSWINLGAGTCNSDLKNTYGLVNMEYHGHKIPTGMQFIGCMMGDYAKTAINTGIFTGKTIGACSMIYGFVTTNVPSFVNYARSFGQVTEAPVEVMAATQARMFARRNVEQRPCDVQLLYDMYELTRHERQLAGEPLSL
jgi:UDP-N-acetylglucosamine diphosphorylase/glucosamine-1-phosphate N-acetyltransferase